MPAAPRKDKRRFGLSLLVPAAASRTLGQFQIGAVITDFVPGRATPVTRPKAPPKTLLPLARH